MRLRYDDCGEPAGRSAIIMLRDASPSRTELHIKQRDNNTFMLVCLAGSKHSNPSKLRAQGPFHSAQQAQGARNAIMCALQKEGYTPASDLPCWELHAQAFANNCRETLALNKGDYDFDPKDVL